MLFEYIIQPTIHCNDPILIPVRNYFCKEETNDPPGIRTRVLLFQVTSLFFSWAFLISLLQAAPTQQGRWC